MSVDHGYRALNVRLARVPVSGTIRLRTAVVSGVLAVVLLLTAVVALCLGTIELTPGEVLAALTGQADPRTEMLVLEWRLPRVAFAVVCGMALAVAGTIFQSLTRNPLGSPDILGFSTGAYTGAIAVMLWFGSTRYTDIALGSLGGGLLTAGVVYLLAYHRGSVQPFRLIIMGIGVAAMLSSLNAALLLFIDVDTAMLAAVWAAGSLNDLGAEQLWPLLGALAVVLVAVAAIASPLTQLELGDDNARALGIPVETIRGAAVVLGVGLTALVTAAVGPIAFVALAAPQIAKRLTRSTGLVLIPSALVGALVLLASDVLAQRAGFPVGVVTVSLGGLYLTWLLASEYRRRA